MKDWGGGRGSRVEGVSGTFESETEEGSSILGEALLCEELCESPPTPFKELKTKICPSVRAHGFEQLFVIVRYSAATGPGYLCWFHGPGAGHCMVLTIVHNAQTGAIRKDHGVVEKQ